MNTTTQFIPYNKTNAFSPLVLDYIFKKETLKPFYNFEVSIDGIKESIKNRKKNEVDRALLIDVFTKQYLHINLSEHQKNNLNNLAHTNTFTITTAHQPNLFTGPLYFIYKILHAVKLAEECKIAMPEYNFIPIYYMGSEDADIDELGHIFINESKYKWQTNQTGAVGRMKVDENLLQLIDEFAGQIAIEPFGDEIITILKNCYQLNFSIEKATFNLVNILFANYGVLILLPDNPIFKKSFLPVIKNELLHQFSAEKVKETVNNFPKEYKIQASGRALNLFYLKDTIRERIEYKNGEWMVVNTTIFFNEKTILEELENFPERFSPNVILRPVFQEFILPNIAFIGGGGEIAYWLELKNVFEKVNVPYPLLVLRNSFLFIPIKHQKIIANFSISNVDLFLPVIDLFNTIVKNTSANKLNLDEEKQNLISIYQQIKLTATLVDKTLINHIEALQTRTLNKIKILEKKILRAEKKKYLNTEHQIIKLKKNLNPQNNLQERIDNFIPYYSKWGTQFIEMLYKQSNGFLQQFGIIKEN